MHQLLRRLTCMLGAAAFCTVAVAQNVSAPANQPIPNTMEERVKACTSCHGQQGRGVDNVYFPRLAGKPVVYLYNQLISFRNGTRQYAPMNSLLAYLPDPYLYKMAEYFSAQKQPFRQPATPAVSAQVLLQGQSIVNQGVAARQIPACNACHGTALGGREPGIPGLLGLRADYISAQLGSWRNGVRRAQPPDCMKVIATTLKEPEIAAVSAWLASQPGNANAPSVVAAGMPLPLDCGSQQFHPVAAVAAPVRATAIVERGRYLARAGDCIACHTVPGARIFSGNRPMPTPFGTMYAPNITPDLATGIGKWNAAEFYQMMHSGRGRDGTLLYPAMPFASYTRISRADTDAIFAYLKSVAPVNNPRRAHALRFPYNNRSLLVGWRALYFSEGEYQPDATQTVEWNRGALLVQGLGHCAMCHTPTNIFGGASAGKAFEGGLIPMQSWYAPSLTSNKEAGLGDWAVKDIMDLLQTGVSHRGAVYGPMAEVTYNSLQYLAEEDIRAMAVYLKGLPGKDSGSRPAPALPTAEIAQVFSAGKRIYEARCASCHASNGMGKLPNYPPLANNPSVEMPSAVNPIRMVLNGGYPPGTARNPQPYGMPPFAQLLTDAEVAAVVTFIRTAWGNHGNPVGAREANTLRSATLD